MSRIGKKTIPVPSGVKATIDGGTVVVEGKSKLSMPLPPRVEVVIDNDVITVKRKDDSRESGAMQGLARSLINNMVIGVTDGFKKELQVVGVGYRAQLQGSQLILNLGYSHQIVYDIPADVKVSVADNTKITIEGADKQLVGEAAATIRRYRKPEPYKGKGIRYANEHITIKEGKSVG